MSILDKVLAAAAGRKSKEAATAPLSERASWYAWYSRMTGMSAALHLMAEDAEIVDYNRRIRS